MPVRVGHTDRSHLPWTCTRHSRHPWSRARIRAGTRHSQHPCSRSKAQHNSQPGLSFGLYSTRDHIIRKSPKCASRSNLNPNPNPNQPHHEPRRNQGGVGVMSLILLIGVSKSYGLPYRYGYLTGPTTEHSLTLALTLALTVTLRR